MCLANIDHGHSKWLIWVKIRAQMMLARKTRKFNSKNSKRKKKKNTPLLSLITKMIWLLFVRNKKVTITKMCCDAYEKRRARWLGFYTVGVWCYEIVFARTLVVFTFHVVIVSRTLWYERALAFVCIWSLDESNICSSYFFRCRKKKLRQKHNWTRVNGIGKKMVLKWVFFVAILIHAQLIATDPHRIPKVYC